MGSSPTAALAPSSLFEFLSSCEMFPALSCHGWQCSPLALALLWWFCTSCRLCWAARGCRRDRNPHGRQGHSASGVQGPRGCRGCSRPLLALWGQGKEQNGAWVVLETVQVWPQPCTGWGHQLGFVLLMNKMLVVPQDPVRVLGSHPKKLSSHPKKPSWDPVSVTLQSQELATRAQ